MLQGGESAPHPMTFIRLVTEHKIIGVILFFITVVFLVSIKNIIADLRQERNRADRED